jgi:hypothetical protein
MPRLRAKAMKSRTIRKYEAKSMRQMTSSSYSKRLRTSSVTSRTRGWSSAQASLRRWSSGLLSPAGSGNAGSSGRPKFSCRLQRSATTMVFRSASGKSANASCISSGVRKWRFAMLRIRFGSSIVFPVWMQSRISCASLWSRSR